MSRVAPEIELTGDERAALCKLARSPSAEHRLVERANIVLLADERRSNQQIAEALQTREARVCKWRRRFARNRMLGLRDGARGMRPRYGESTQRRILETLDKPPPAGHATWTGSLVAQALGDVSDDQVWRVLRDRNISLERRRSWCISNDLDFAAKAADIVGLYLDPPTNALVLSIDEKPSIQALERAQGWLRLPDGTGLTGVSHGYKRHGTTTLFAALDVVTGKIKTGHYTRRRRREFLHFMNDVIAEYPDREVHVVLDNLNTHKPKCDRWLQRHRNVHFHFTPTYSSWLNQVECWFSILARQALRGASFTSPQQVRGAIDRFVAGYNEIAAPFEWKATKVHASKPTHTYAERCK
ncbi:MAG: IS630 family transposase [Candidatus Eremiobacteraeota bacterium]|nr:IS630 family transposase [Candidatus Eremiobacteraeota bacterium]MBC5803098.1 IS630 family transposase [Candidatus Eremiobacteraeota bacterium]MBC5821440.1 IS630 family transposase [Candidatus Eremiobacteraeota bacterium]